MLRTNSNSKFNFVRIVAKFMLLQNYFIQTAQSFVPVNIMQINNHFIHVNMKIKD